MFTNGPINPRSVTDTYDVHEPFSPLRSFIDSSPSPGTRIADGFIVLCLFHEMDGSAEEEDTCRRA